MSWNEAYLESLVLSGDPLELVRMLYRHAIERTQDARALLASGDIAGRGKAISAVAAILAELEGSLDHKAGGSLSQELGRLYQYMQMRLLEANVRRSDEILAEVQSLLTTLAEAWDAPQPEASSQYEYEAREEAPPAGLYGSGTEELATHGWCA
jgi:flagellar secretion chaperone FliS